MASKTKEGENRKKKDPFAYFGGLGDIEDDDEASGSEDSEPETDSKKLAFITKSKVDENGQRERLPSANEILDLSSKPKFLNTDAKVDIDWDKYARDDTKEPEEPVNYSSNAIPPPKTYDPVTDPLKPTIGGESDGQDGEERGSRKRNPPADGSDEGDSKKTKTENVSDSS